MEYNRPIFLNPEVFEWDALGYQFSSEPTLDLMNINVLKSENPWLLLAAILTRASKGQFDTLTYLYSCFCQSKDLSLWRACFNLLGDAGSLKDLEILYQRFHSELFEANNLAYQQHIPKSFHQSMLLATVPKMLAIYLESKDHQETGFITVFLSRILEQEFGPVAWGLPTDEKYYDLVIKKYEELSKEFGTDNIPVLYGEIFSVKRLSQRLYSKLRYGSYDSVSIIRDRHIFEASTGISCSLFFKNEELQPLSAITILEDFLESSDANKYEDGVRYFFGNRISSE